MARKLLAKRMRIPYEGNTLRFQALVDQATGDLVSLEDVAVYRRHKGEEIMRTVEQGAVWMPNRMVYRRSQEQTGYQCFERGKYDRMRAGWHMVQRYGVRSQKPGTEAQRLARDDGLILLTAVQLMSRGASLTRRDLWLAETVEPLVTEYADCYDIRKAMARQDLERGRRLKDSLGRDNAGAAALSLGAARGNIQLRRAAITKLEGYMRARAQETAEEIACVRDAYRLLWCCFHPRAYVHWAHEDAGLERPTERGPEEPGWLVAVEQRDGRSDIARAMHWFPPIFRAMRALPFRHNAAHVVRDLEQALEYIMAGNQASLRDCLIRLQDGLRWYFALDFLQMRVITPLSLVIEDLRIAYGTSAEPGKKRAKFVPHLEMAAEAFLGIASTFGDFKVRMYKPIDHLLENPVREKIECLVDAADKAMHDDQWLPAKELLLSIAGHL